MSVSALCTVVICHKQTPHRRPCRCWLLLMGEIGNCRLRKIIVLGYRKSLKVIYLNFGTKSGILLLDKLRRYHQYQQNSSFYWVPKMLQDKIQSCFLILYVCKSSSVLSFCFVIFEREKTFDNSFIPHSPSRYVGWCSRSAKMNLLQCLQVCISYQWKWMILTILRVCKLD